MNFRLTLLGIVTLAVLLAACAPPPELRDQSLLSDTSLLASTEEACSAPCWRGITPGETAWRDALTVIEDADDLENVQSQTDEATHAVGAVWQPKGGTQCCQMVAEDGETVSVIFLRMKPDHTVSELIEAHGEPTYAIGTPLTDDQAIVNLVYPDVPMIVFAFAGGAEKGEISASSEIIGAFYTTPDEMDIFIQTNYLHDWEGFAPYSTYKNDEGSDFEITPSVTITPTATGQ
jgi:hypothetical protein